MLMEMFMRGNGNRIKHTVRESIFTWTVRSTMEIEQMIGNMVLVQKLGLMVHNTKVNMIRGKNMEEGNSNGQMVLALKGILKITISKDLVFILGLMEENTKEVGNKIKWKGKEHFPGRTEEFTMENI